MPDFYQKITAEQGSLEDLVRKLPGFKGYFNKNDRRAADRLLREQIARKFEEQQTRFVRLQRELVEEGGLKYMERVQRIDTKLQTFIDRIKTASLGYRGLFDAIKVEEDDLQRLYAFDNALLAYQDQLATGLHELEQVIGTDGDVRRVLNQLEDVVTEANNTFKRREEAFQEFGATEPPATLG